MLYLSKSGEELIEKCADSSHSVDTLIIGSGYGGSVAALRLAEYGCKVYVLERGDEYVSGEFPNDLSQVGKHVRADVFTPTGVNSVGNENALFDVKLGVGVGAIVGNGLGGGSLINAAIGLEANPEVFKQESWPAGIRDEDLSKYYEKARNALDLQTPGKPRENKELKYDPSKTKKYRRLHEISIEAKRKWNIPDSPLHVRFEPLPMGIQLEENPSQENGKREVCNGCGDCVTGCNYHAKLSLTATYLPTAVKNGAEIFTGLTVLKVKKNPLFNKNSKDDSRSSFEWEVTFVRTNERKIAHSIVDPLSRNNDTKNDENSVSENSPKHVKHWEYRIFARRVILSAGTFGSTEILLRSRLGGLEVSKTALGVGFSGNGDDISFAFGLDKEVNGIGHGASKKPSENPSEESTVGPTASAVIYFDDQEDFTRSSIMEDGAIPGLMRRVLGELTHTLGTIIQITEIGKNKNPNSDSFANNPRNNRHTLGLLGMGHDSAGGILALDAVSDRLAIAWPNTKNETSPKFHKVRQAIVEKLGAIFIQNPATGLLPDKLSQILNGPSQETRMVTVHPLGGCRMGDNVYIGVVNHWGGVFIDNGTSVDNLHNGLFVLDGSIIPTAVGVNPMLTITALAERACEKILLGIKKPQQTPVLQSIDPYKQPTPDPLDLSKFGIPKTNKQQSRLSEILRCGRISASQEFMHLIGAKETDVSAALFIEMKVEDWEELLNNNIHEVSIIPTHIGKHRSTRSRLVIDTEKWDGEKFMISGNSVNFEIMNGTVRLFEKKPQTVLAHILETIKVLITYGFVRWLPDKIKSKTRKNTSKKSKFSSKKQNSWEKFKSFANLGWHASEIREFHYESIIQYKNQKFHLVGKKTVRTAADWSDIFNCMKSIHIHFEAFRFLKEIFKSLTAFKFSDFFNILKNFSAFVVVDSFPKVKRQSVWEQLTQVEIEVSQLGSNENSFTGRFVMDFPEMFRRFAPQIGPAEDTINGLVNFAKYPMQIFRAIIKTRFLDFRLPDYLDEFDESALPFNDPSIISKPKGYKQFENIPDFYKYPPLKLSDAKIEHDAPLSIMVKLTDTSSENIEIGLIRYSQKREIQLTNIRESKGGYKAKSIILINGLALTTHAFVAEELKEKNFAAMLYAAGWDVWLLEYRGSPLLDASSKYSSIDDIARFDIPKAIDTIIDKLSSELGVENSSINSNNLQIYCFSHCVGSASLMMSILGGRLRHKPSGISKLAGILISQFQPIIVGSKTTQMRLQLAALIRNALGLDVLQFTAGQTKTKGVYALLDRFLASFNYSDGNVFDNEECTQEENLTEHQPDSTSCKRMTGIFGRSMVHKNLLEETHKKLDLYFGRANVGVFLHGAKCVNYERLVNMDGQNIYITDRNFSEFLDMPVMLLHGDKNALFDPKSLELSKDQLNRIVVNRNRGESNLNRYHLAVGYGHFDCTIGKDAHKDIFKPTIDFFENVHKHLSLFKNYKSINVFVNNRNPETKFAYHSKLPMIGPLIGWTRETETRLIYRIWIEIDNDGSGFPESSIALTKFRVGKELKIQAWRVYKQEIKSRKVIARDLNNKQTLHASVYFAVADICIARNDLTQNIVNVEVISLKRMITPVGAETPPTEFVKFLNGHEILVKPCNMSEITHSLIEPLYEIREDEKESVYAEFFTEYKFESKKQFRRAVSANPNTLSRRKLDQKSFSNCSLKLDLSQFLNKDETLSFVIAGCRHLGLTEFEKDRSNLSLQSIAKNITVDKPKFMLMLGDQIYADARAGILDRSTLIERLIPRYREAFGSDGFRAVSKRLPIYNVIDDHEILDNWSQELIYADKVNKVLFKNAKSAFFVFQRSYGPPPIDKYSFDYTFSKNGYDFFVLDTRSNKTRVPKRKILSRSQWKALKEWLSTRDSNKPKFIVTGSVVAPGLYEYNTNPSPRQADNWQMSKDERDKLFDLILQYEQKNVVFISSDYHCSAISKIKIGNDLEAFAVVAPALHAPMIFANATAQEIMLNEEIVTKKGTTVRITSKAWNGEGWINVNLTTNPEEIILNFNLKDFGDYHFKPFNFNLFMHQ